MSYEALLAEARNRVLARDLSGALTLIGEAIGRDARRPEAFNLLGVVEALGHERDDALAHWRVALVLAPEYEPAQTNLRHATQWPRSHVGLVLG